MDLKSSSLEFCKRQAIVAYRVESEIRFSTAPSTSPSRASFSPSISRAKTGLLGHLALLAGTALLPSLAFSQTAAKLPVRVDLTASTVEGPNRTQATLTARVLPTELDGANAAAPTGSVSFLNGEQSIGAAFVDKEGRATYTATALPAGLQKITAVYQGDDSFRSATSTAAPVNSATSGVPGFTLTASNASLNVVAGQTATTVITTTPENGFNQSVSFSCSGLPYTSTTCIFSPTQVTPGSATAAAPNGTPVISTLSIQTTAYNTELQLPGSGRQTAYAIAIPGVLAFAGLGLARKRGLYGKAGGAARLMGLFFLLLAGGMGMGACSQRYKYYHKPPTGNPGTPAGTYTVVISGITGTGSSLSTATTQMTLVVTI